MCLTSRSNDQDNTDKHERLPRSLSIHGDSPLALRANGADAGQSARSPAERLHRRM
jgi:hypothetical protein